MVPTLATADTFQGRGNGMGGFWHERRFVRNINQEYNGQFERIHCLESEINWPLE